jgi:hypothetical protein
VFAIWLAMSYARGAWTTAIAFVALFVAFYLLAPLVAAASDGAVRTVAAAARTRRRCCCSSSR